MKQAIESFKGNVNDIYKNWTLFQRAIESSEHSALEVLSIKGIDPIIGFENPLSPLLISIAKGFDKLTLKLLTY